MKRINLLLILVIVVLFVAGSSNAAIHVFNPDPADMYDLDHYYAYSWGIDWQVPETEQISEARLTITGINNWWDEDNTLFMHLLDQAPAGLLQFSDDANNIEDYFAGQGILIDEWSDPDGGPHGDYVNISYSFRDMGLLDDFMAYAADGNFGFALDPDCHYFNDKIQFTVITDTPEPATILLFGMGLVGSGLIRRKKK